MAGLVEMTGGVLLAIGLATPIAATIFVAVMFVAAVGVHMRNGFFITENGYEYNLVLAVAGVTLAFTGPGDLSLDAFLGWSTAGLAWGLAAIILGLVAGSVQLAHRRSTMWPVSEGSAQNRGTAA